MELLTEDEIEDRWARALSMDDSDRAAAWRGLKTKQLTLFAWLGHRGETRFEPEVAELLISTATLIWAVFAEDEDEDDDDQQLLTVGPDELAKLEEVNAPILQMLSEDEALKTSFEERFDNLVYHLEEGLDQQHLFQLAFERLDDAHADRNPELNDFNFALLLFFLKILIDALDGE
ncbi:MAG: hypothetical protein ACI8UO_003029 [Verrucomicrobiales bacterium]|jgi:hypothetical protein